MGSLNCRHVMKDEQVAMASQTWLKPQLDSPEGTKKASPFPASLTSFTLVCPACLHLCIGGGDVGTQAVERL